MSAVQSHPEIVIFRSGASTVRADYFPGETVLDTARRAGVPIATSCELGNCGTCIVELLKGRVEMANNNALDPEEVEAGSVLACQSVPTGPRCEVRIF